MSRPAPLSDELVANSPVGTLRELASGIDALYLSARAELPADFLSYLELSRDWATEMRRPVPCEIGGTYFGMAGHGWGKYRFCLDHPMARLGFSTSRHLPAVRVQPRAEYLHAEGPESVVAAMRALLKHDLGDVFFSVSRVDLFADWQGWNLTLDDAHRFVCRADTRRTYEVGGTLTGFEFGGRKTKTFSARLYDKTADVAVKGSDWWLEVWGERYVPGLPVHRLEFEVGRQGLVDFDLDTPGSVLATTGDLWAYATKDWLTFRSPTADATRSRWPLAREWLAVQQATLTHRSVGIDRLRSARRSTSIARLLPGLNGYMASLAALTDAEGIDDIAGAIGQHLRDYEIISRTAFSERVAAGAANWNSGEHGRARLRAGGRRAGINRSTTGQ
ncbi:MAG: hypothetical protein ACLQCU_13845 [Acidimicrobiales bacterium]